MSAFSHTDWTVTCNGLDGKDYGKRCQAQGRTDLLVGAITAADVRRHLKRLGWAVNVPVQDVSSAVRRLDFCPEHKDMSAYKVGTMTRQRKRRAATAGEE